MKSLRQVWAAAQGNPRNPKIAKRFKRSKNQEAKRPLIPLPLLKAAAKRRWESEGIIPSGGFGIGVTRPLCGIQRDGNRKSQGALARSRSGRVCRRQRTAPLCEFPGSAAQGNPRNPKIAKRVKRNKNQEAKRPLIPLTPLKTAAKRRWESEDEIPPAGFRDWSHAPAVRDSA